MTLPSQRSLFEIPDEVCYLNCAYMSPQLRSMREIGERSVARKSRPWEITSEDFFTDSETARELFAHLVGGEPDGVALVPSASYGTSVAAANLPVEPGQSIVVLEEQFPSNVYPWLELAKGRGAKWVSVPRPADSDWTPAVLERINEGTAIVAVPNCHWTDGSFLDLWQIGERARETGAALVVDATQSLGACPLNVSEIRPDFLVAAAYKWLLGPYSTGFLYVDEAFRQGEPIEHNWVNREASEDFAHLVEYVEGFQPGARRYDVGERSNFILLPMANEALRRILDWGVEEISESIGKLTVMIEKTAEEHGIEALPAKRRVKHMIGLHLGPDAPDDLAVRLAAQNVFVSVRGNSLRVSPHLYNTQEDVDKLFKVLAEVR